MISLWWWVSGGVLLGAGMAMLWMRHARHVIPPSRNVDEPSGLLEVATRYPAQMNLLLGSMSDALWIVDLRKRALLFASDSILKIYGLSRHEIEIKPDQFMTAVHDDDKSLVKDAMERLTRGEAIDFEHRVVWPSGDVYWIHVEAYCLLNDRHSLLVGGISRDVTSQKRLAAYWRASEERYRRLVGMADACIIVFDDSYHVLEWNEAAERIFGMRRAEAIGLSYFDHFVFDEDRSELKRQIGEMSVNNDYFRIEKTARTASGERRVLSWNNRLYINPQSGRREIISVGVDVTELRRISQDLARNEQLFRTVFENAPAAMALIDQSGCLMRLNKEYERFYDMRADQLLGRHVAELAAPDEMERVSSDLERIATHETESVSSMRRHLTPSGQIRWGSTRLILQDAATSTGNTLFLEQIIDVTDRKRAEEALYERERQLSTMVGNLSGIVYRYSTKLGAGVLLRDGRYLMYNLHHDWRPTFMSEGTQRITGFRADSFTQADVFSFGHLIVSEDRSGLIPRVERSINDSVPFELVYRIRGATQDIRWISERGQAFIDNSGEILIEGLLVDITTQKLAEEGEQVYRQLVADTHTGFLALDANGLVKDANQPFLDFLGVSRLSIIQNHSVYEWTAPEYKEITARMLQEVSTQGAIKDLEVEYLRPNGKRVSLSLSAVATRTDHELIIKCLLFDITQRRIEQQELEQSRNLLAESHRIAGLGSWTAVVGEDNIFWSDELYDLLGYVGQHPPASINLFLDHVHPDDRERVRQRLHEGNAQGDPYAHEFRMIRRDGAVCYMRNSVSFERDRMGRVMRVVGVLQDVTLSKLAEQAILQSEKRYRSLFDTSVDGICFLSMDGRIEEANAAFLGIVGYTPEEITLLHEQDITPDEWHVLDQEVKQQQILVQGFCESYRKEYCRKDGNHVPISIRQWLVRDENNQPLRVMAMVRDVTEFKKIEYEREQLQRGLQQAQKMEAIGHLTGGIAHDFNNILTSILGYSDLALRQVANDPQSRMARYLTQVKTAGERARELISQMLIFSRGGSSPGKIQIISPLVQSTIKMLRPTVPTSIRLRTHISHAVSPVLVDTVQLQQIVMNLVINARDAMSCEGEILVMVRETQIHKEHCASCHARVEGDYVELVVRDTGEGIDAVILNRIFDPFFTTKEVGKGSGMGLSVVHGIMHEFGGHILVNSQKGRGTTFRILFKPQQFAPGEEDAAIEQTEVPLHFGNHRVLIVDDEPAVAHMIGDLLTLQGYQVEVVTDSLHALEMIRTDPASFDALVTDHVMPGLVGYDLILKVRELRQDFPVVMCSAQAELLARQSARPMTWPVVSKPIDPEVLISTLESVLNISQGVDDKALS